MVNESTITKRAKTEDSKEGGLEIYTPQKSLSHNGLFQPFRALGFVANEVPFNIRRQGTENIITTSTGNAFQIYNCEKLNLLFVSPQTTNPITALESSGDFTFAATGCEIIVYRRAKPIKSFSNKRSGSIFQMLVLGDHLFVLTEDNVFSVFCHITGELETEIEFGSNFRAMVFAHPSTYVNKVVIGSAQGTMQLWNIKTNKLIYEFASLGSIITALAQSPVIDVMCIGQLDGTITVHHLKSDETIVRLQQETRVTAITFRSDDHPIMATAGINGDIAIWDLEKRRLLHLLKNAHEGIIPSIEFLAGQPILVTSGVDNAVREYIFDSPDGLPRLLKFRSGHHAAPTHVRFYDSEGKFLLSSARDRTLRMFSVIRDSQSTELSQGSGLAKQSNLFGISMDQLKLPQITDFYACELKEQNWDNIVTIHTNEAGARTWSYKRKAIGNHILYSKDNTALKAVTVTGCGNFTLIGAASGRVDMFNIQSGAHRREFIGHTKAVSGVVVDRANKYVITSSLDKTIKLWDFKTGKEVYSFAFGTPITQLIYHSDNELVAVVGDDLCIRVLDFETRRCVREFWGHRNRITDLTFSPDGRWLVSAGLDATIRTWDLPSGYCIDCFRVDNVVTSLTFSPVGDYLATTHVDNLGIFLWANRSQYMAIRLGAVTDEDILEVTALPTAAGQDENGEDVVSTDVVALASDIVSTDYQTPDQLSEHMITLSTQPKLRWQNLLNLEAIKKRNKPIEPPKQPERAPFFLPTVAGIVPTFAPIETNSKSDISKRNGLALTSGYSEFSQQLCACNHNRDYSRFIAYATTLSPSALDIELRTLTPNYFTSFLQSILFHLKSRKSFELAQAWLNVFLKLHGDMLSRDDECKAIMQEVLNLHSHEWRRVESGLRYCNCLLDILRDT